MGSSTTPKAQTEVTTLMQVICCIPVSLQFDDVFFFLLQGSIVHITSPVVDPITKADTPTNEKASMDRDGYT